MINHILYQFKKTWPLIIGLFIVLFLTVQCDPPVVFDQPYPLNEADLEEIPENFVGVYMCESDSSLIWISDQLIVHESYHFFQTSLARIKENENCSVEDGNMVLPGRNECIPLTYLNDSVVRGEYIVSDTLFKNKDQAVARMYQGHLVISTKLDKKEWMIHYLSPDKENLLYRSIVDRSNLKQVEKVTPMEEITTDEDKNKRYIIRPSMTEFNAIFHNKAIFIECEYLYRVKVDISSNPTLPKFKNSDLFDNNN